MATDNPATTIKTREPVRLGHIQISRGPARHPGDAVEFRSTFVLMSGKLNILFIFDTK